MFADAENEVEEYEKTQWDSVMEQPCDGGNNIIDPGDVADSIHEESITR